MTGSTEKMAEALVKLNAELDAYWNDPSQAGARPPEVYTQNITIAQQECNTALAAYRAAGEGESDGPIHSWLSGLDGRAAEFERRQASRRRGGAGGVVEAIEALRDKVQAEQADWAIDTDDHHDLEMQALAYTKAIDAVRKLGAQAQPAGVVEALAEAVYLTSPIEDSDDEGNHGPVPWSVLVECWSEHAEHCRSGIRAALAQIPVGAEEPKSDTRNAALEEAAKVCDEIEQRYRAQADGDDQNSDSALFAGGMQAGAKYCATMVRALKSEVSS